MITDPHYIPYGSLNLDSDLWRQCKRDKRMKELSERLIEIFFENSTAVIPKPYLEDLGFDLAAECGQSYERLKFTEHWHWSSISLCILSHGCYEDEGVQIRFSKSEYEGRAYLPENIKKISDPTCRWGKNVLKDSKPVVIPEPPAQWSLF